MDIEDVVSLSVALRSAVSHLQTAVNLLIWRTGSSLSEAEQALLRQAKVALEAATRLEESAPEAPAKAGRQLRDGISTAAGSHTAAPVDGSGA